MEFSTEETEKLKRMLLFLVKRKHNESGGHNGLHPMDLIRILEEMEGEGSVQRKKVMNGTKYFLK